MCATCTTFHADRCPDVPSRPDADHAEQLAVEKAVQALIAANHSPGGQPTVDAATDVILRVRLGPAAAWRSR